MFKLTAWVNEGEYSPKHMGMVYTYFARNQSFYCLLPFNWPWRGVLGFYYWIKLAKPMWWESKMAEHWSRGYDSGRKAGITEGESKLERLFEDAVKKRLKDYMEDK